MNQDTEGPIKAEEVCLECGSPRLKEQIKEQKFPYGPPATQTTLTASMPVFICQDCGYEFFDERGESARHDAVCRHLGVQTPNEIRTIREAAGLSRTEFCEIGGFGIASLQRWESGEVIPNASSDRLIYLLQYDDNLDRLRRRTDPHAEPVAAIAACSQDVESVGPDSDRLLEAHGGRRNISNVVSFPALERRGELGKCLQDAKRIRRCGGVLFARG